MTVTVSVLLLLSVAMFFLFKAKALPIGPTFVAVLWTAFLEQTGALAWIRRTVMAVFTALTQIQI
jgi:hypothetical protein